MYNQRIIDQNISFFESKNGWELVRHSFDEVSDFIAYMKAIVKIGSNSKGAWIESVAPLTTKRKAEIKRWIENEQVLCNPPEAPIWMADYTFKALGEIKIGDEVIGWEREVRPGFHKKDRHKNFNFERLKKARVLEIYKQNAPIIKITMESGRVIRCTKDHLWSNGATYRSEIPWINPKIGRILRRVIDVYPNEPTDTRKAAWLAWCKPARSHSIEKKMMKTLQGKPDKIVSIEPDGCGEVIAMKTTTGNYVAWGYASKNCGLDYKYWRDNYAYVVDEGGQTRKFKNRRSQDVFDSVIADLEEQQAGIQLICLKARQVGITTLVSLYFIHKMLFIPNTLSVMASVQKEKSEEIEIKLNTAYDSCPFWLVPPRAPKRSFENGSRLSIESGMQPKGIAQGKTPNNIHISEIGLIPNPHNVIEEGLLPATHSNRNLFMVFEGTGSGNVGWFPDFWRSQKRDWPLGLARMCPVFISWPLATDLYPQSDWLRQHPVPSGFYERRLDATKAHITRCEAYIRNTSYLSKVVGASYRVPVEQQWFWQFEYVQAKERHSLQQHAARLPADDFEALTGVHDSVFDQETIMELEEDIYEIRTDGTKQRRKPAQIYAITGHSIDEEFEPSESEIDYAKDIIHLTWKSNRDERYDWELVPLLPVDEETESYTFDKLFVFEPPQKGGIYSCGVDTAHGLGKEDEDRFCASMTRVSSGAGCDVQAAELTSNRFSPAQAVPFLAAIATWYGQISGHYRGVKFSIEQVEGPGDTCQNQLKIMGFNYHHTPGRLDGKKIKDENRHREGWYSNRTTVPILMDRFVEAVNGGWYVPASKWLIEELKTLERHVVDGGRDKMTHQKNKHDDRVRAAAQSYLNCHTYDDLSARAQRRYQQPARKKHDPNKGKCMSNTFSVGDW